MGKVLGIFLLLAIALAIYLLFLRPAKTTAPATSQITEQQPAEKQPEEQKPQYKLVDVQSIIDNWGSKQSGDYSIVVYDLDKQTTVGEHQPDKIYFAASIYKIYVAYEGYLAAANGQYDLSEPYLGSRDRGECLDAMIRASYSPCAEKLWVELGKQELTDKMHDYGIKNTSLVAITTTAQDATTLLTRLYERSELPEDLTQKYLNSMLEQEDVYRRGLPSGMPEATVYNKVGWNELKEWHDTAIVELPNNRHYVITIFTENVGMTNVRELGSQLYQALNID